MISFLLAALMTIGLALSPSATSGAMAGLATTMPGLLHAGLPDFGGARDVA